MRTRDSLEACFASLRIADHSPDLQASTSSFRDHSPDLQTSSSSFREGGSLRNPLDDSSTLVFYTHTLCPYACRSWLALLEKVSPLKTFLLLAGQA